MRLLMLCFLLLSYTATSAQEWKQLPGPTRARVIQTQLDKFGNIYAITDSNDVYRSIDSGNTWKKLQPPKGIKRSQYISLSASKIGPIYLTASIYSRNSYVTIDSQSTGLYRSSDQGQTWQQVVTKNIFNHIVDYGQKNLYASALWNTTTYETNIYKSSDNGLTWKLFKTLPFMCSRFDIDNGERIYFQENDRSLLWIFAGDGGYIGQITDTTIVKNERTTYGQGVCKYLGNSKFGYLSDSVFYLKNGDNDWIRKSRVVLTDGNRTGQVLVVGKNNDLYTVSYNINGQQSYSLHISTDMGSTWKEQLISSTVAFNFSFFIDSDGNILISDYYGLYRRTVADTTRKVIGFPIATIVSLAVDKNGSIFAADSSYHTGSSRFNTLLKSSDDGKNWNFEFGASELIGNIGLSPDSGIFCVRDSTPFNSNQRLLLHYQPDVNSWSKITSFEYIYSVNEYKFFPPTSLYIDASRSDDGGNTWETLYSAPPVPYVYDHSYTVAAPGRVLIGYRPAIYMTEDNGVTWKKLQHNLSDRNITALYADQENLIIAGSEYGDIILSNDKGSSWIDWRGSLQGSIKKITATVDNTIYVATTKGLYSRGLNDTDWKLEIPDKEIVAIGFGKDNEVFACISQEGIWTDWKKHFPTVKQGIAKKGIQGVSISPTPARNVVKADFDLDKSGEVSITFFDELGRKVFEKQELLREGWHQLRLETSAVPSGIYHIQLVTLSGKMMSKVLITH